jgi:hypothetical protein
VGQYQRLDGRTEVVMVVELLLIERMARDRVLEVEDGEVVAIIRYPRCDHDF